MSKELSSREADWREGRRLRAWELHEQGWRQQEIATALAVTKRAVSQWMLRGRILGSRRRSRHGWSGGCSRLPWLYVDPQARHRADRASGGPGAIHLSLVPVIGWLVEPVIIVVSEDGQRLGDRAAYTQVIAVAEYTRQPLL